jgi:hypothetical protein
MLKLLLEDRFPRIWIPSWENRDLRQLLWHRHHMVQARTRIMNQLQAVALTKGCDARRGCGEKRDESNWRGSDWRRGRVDDGTICSSYWTDLLPRLRVATQVFPSGDATRPENRQSRYGAPARGSFVLDVAPRMGLRAVEKVQSARGTARNRRWCAIEHRVIDGAARSPSRGSSN